MGNFEQRKRTYEADLGRLVGHRLSAVRYFEIQYEAGTPGWSSVPAIGHSLDFGLDLAMADGAVFSLTWGNEFYPYGISVISGSLRTQLFIKQFAEFNVSSDPHWKAYLGKDISRVQVFWSWVDLWPEEKRIHYPQEVALFFDPLPPVYVSASQYSANDDKVSGMFDELLVVFSEEVARRYGLGPYAIDSTPFKQG